ncbi:hypothetical protein L1887_18970 [Cichorium endivia]|nr:hypothetical protein L1887_18970 [Cichorium endivia]
MKPFENILRVLESLEFLIVILCFFRRPREEDGVFRGGFLGNKPFKEHACIDHCRKPSRAARLWGKAGWRDAELQGCGAKLAGGLPRRVLSRCPDLLLIAAKVGT